MVLVAFALFAMIASVYLLRDPRPRFDQRRSHLVSVSAGPVTITDGYEVELVNLRAASGLEVELAVKRPLTTSDDENGRPPLARPLVVLLGGHRTGRNAVHLIDDTRGMVVAALSYPFAGDHRAKGLDIVRQVPEMRDAILDTPPAIMLALDYLLAQPYVDRTRVEAVGVSLGSPFAVLAGAMDQRVGRVWAVHGAGGVYSPLELNLRRQVGSRFFSVPLAGLATMLISGPRIAPDRWVADIAPREFVMINAIDDQRIPRESIDALYRRAREPKERMWMTGGHVRSEAEAVRPLVALVLDRMQAIPLGSLDAETALGEQAGHSPGAGPR